MLAGASAVGIGYAGFRNPTALITIIDDLEAWCDERGIKKVTELIGAVKDDDMEMDHARRGIGGRLSRRTPIPYGEQIRSTGRRRHRASQGRTSRSGRGGLPRRAGHSLPAIPPSRIISAWLPRPRASIVPPSAISTMRSRPSRNTRRRITTAPRRIRRSANQAQAIQGFERVCAIEPGHYDAHRALGFLWLAEGDRGRALDHFARTYELRRGEDRTGIASRSLTEATRSKLVHDAEQFRFLSERRRDRQRFEALARNYEEAAKGAPGESGAALRPADRPARRGLQHRDQHLRRTGACRVPRSATGRTATR